MIVLRFLFALWNAIASHASDARVELLRANVRLLAEVSDADESGIYDQVDAAISAETRRVPAELLLAVAWGESRFRTDVATGRVCGPLQVAPGDLGMPYQRTCEIWEQEPVEAYAAGVKEIEMMLADARVHGSMTLALMYRACGNAAFWASPCVKAKRMWPAWVLARAAFLGRVHADS